MNKWFISIKKRGDDIFDLSGLKRWETPSHKYEADPFLIKRNGKNYIFYEDYDHKKGVISYSTIEGLSISEPTKVLEMPFHLSYPAIFEDSNEVYMIPETGSERKIQLFRAVRFPDKWELEKIIWDDGNYADSTIIKYKGSWWLFTTGGSDYNLVILRADSLMGQWSKHFEKVIRHSRGAGKPFEYQGKLIRPVQHYSEKIYGKSIIFKEITLPGYSERVVRTIDSNWYPNLIGTHTFNFSEDYVVLDGKIKI